MSDIRPIGRTSAAAFERTTQTRQAPSNTAGQTRGRDQVEFSRTAQLLSKLSELPDIRQGLVDRVRSEIASGTYETQDKIDGAIDSLSEELL